MPYSDEQNKQQEQKEARSRSRKSVIKIVKDRIILLLSVAGIILLVLSLLN